jgi:SAM-dependent methyltransferase
LVVVKPTRVIKPEDPAFAGQQHYTPGFLKVYDPLVLGFFSRIIWRCPNGRLVDHYNRHLGRRHLDVGPGTGYFLNRARLPTGAQISLLDPNPNVLAHASRRLAHLAPSVVEADIRQPLAGDQRFDSVALNYVLHCLPGPMSSRTAVISNIAAILEPNGILFGATVLGSPGLHTPLSILALRDNNRRGIFDNLFDTEDGLREILASAFETIDLEIVGAVAIFSARRSR